MLRRIEINRFKSIHDQAVSFGNVNLFIGGNGAGKSNVLEAIGVLSAALERGVTESDLSRKGLRLSTPALFKSAFKNERLPRTLRMSAEFDNECSYAFELTAKEADTGLHFHTENARLGSTTMFGRSGNGATAMGTSLRRTLDDHRSVWDQARAAFDVPEQMLQEFEQISRFAIYSPQTSFLRGEQVGTVQFPPIGLHGEGLPQAMRATLKQLSVENKRVAELHQAILALIWLPGWASSCTVDTARPQIVPSKSLSGSETLYYVDRFMHRQRNKLSAYDASEGTLFLTFLAVLLLHKDAPQILALDNVDSALNPAMTRKVLELLINVTTDARFSSAGVGPVQLFLTSHNPTALDAFDLFDDRVRVFVVSRSDDGKTILSRIEVPKGFSRERWIEAKAGRTLSELWIENEIPNALGGV